MATTVAAIIGGLGYAVQRGVRTRSMAGQVALVRGVSLALALSAVWMIYILGTHLLLPDADKPTLGSALTFGTFAITAAAVALTAAYSAWQARSYRVGLAIGLTDAFPVR